MGTLIAGRSAFPVLATALACATYAATLALGWYGLGALPVQWMALPVLLAASLLGRRAALLAALALAALTFAAWLSTAHAPAPETQLALAGFVAGVPLVGFVLGGARDRQVLAIARLEARNERYAAAVHGSGDGLYEWDLASGRVYYAETFAQLLGCRPEELRPHPDEWLGRVHADDLAALHADIEAHLAGHTDALSNEHRIRCKDGSWLWVLARAKAARDARGRPARLSGWLIDIHDRKRSEDQLRHHAFHDALTGLPNRALFMDRLAHALARARRSASHRFAIVLLDLDRFKEVNDRLGHVAGDELLVAVAERLERCVRPGDTVARLGGDEFMLLLEDVDGIDGARSVAERIERELSAPLDLGAQEVVATASIGIAVGDGSVSGPNELLRDADAAMYESKARGSGQIVSFDARMHDRALERMHLESALRSAIDRSELSVYYQPIVRLSDRTIVGIEALARWRHASFGQVAPMRFIRLAEETGLIPEIGSWVLTQAAREAQRLARLYPERALVMHVNVSPRQLEQDQNLVDRIDRALAESGLSPGLLTIELTEAAVMGDIERGERVLRALRERGIHLCMDDFGTGYSSLSYVHRFRVDSLKIDLSFVRGLTEPGPRGELAHTILTLARTLGLKAIAEGVETEAQLARLRELGCDSGQGFLFAPPVDAATLESLLASAGRS